MFAVLQYGVADDLYITCSANDAASALSIPESCLLATRNSLTGFVVQNSPKTVFTYFFKQIQIH